MHSATYEVQPLDLPPSEKEYYAVVDDRLHIVRSIRELNEILSTHPGKAPSMIVHGRRIRFESQMCFPELKDRPESPEK